MHQVIPRLLPRLALAAAAAGTLLSGGALAQAPSPGTNAGPSLDLPAITRRDTLIDDSGVYRQEVRDCLSGWSQQARDTCLEEARNARADRERGVLALPPQDYTANALKRCEHFAGEDRVACEARVMGFGGSSGSIAAGGMLRWVETVALPRGEDQVQFRPRTSEPVVVIRY